MKSQIIMLLLGISLLALGDFLQYGQQITTQLMLYSIITILAISFISYLIAMTKPKQRVKEPTIKKVFVVKKSEDVGWKADVMFLLIAFSVLVLWQNLLYALITLISGLGIILIGFSFYDLFLPYAGKETDDDLIE